MHKIFPAKKIVISLFLFAFFLTPAFASEKPEIFVQLGHALNVWSVAFSPDGRYALSGSWDNTLKLWEVSSGREIRTFQGHSSGVSSIAFSPDGRYALSGSKDNTLKLWEVSSGREIRTFTGHTDFVESVAFSPDGRYALSGSKDNTLKLWEVSSGREIRTFTGHTSGARSVAFSPDGRYVLSGSGDETMKLWEVSSGREIRTFQGHSSGVSSIAFSPDGRYALSGSKDNTLKLWEVSSGREIRTFTGHTDFVESVAFSPDGRYALSGSKDNTLKLWEVSSGREIRTFTGHTSGARSVAFSPDGRHALSVSASVATAIWDVASGREIAQFISFTNGEWIVITPESYYNSSANGDKHLNVRIGNNVYGIENYREAFFRPDLVKVALSGGSLKDFKTLADVKQPPVVSIVDTPKTVNKDEVTVTLKIIDSGGGTGDIRLYLNGSAVVLDSARGVKIVPTNKNEVLKTYNLKLSNGLNTIRAIAFNGENTMQSNDVLHEITASFKSLAKPSLNAIIVGINEYKNPKLQLKYAVSDAELFEATLKKVTAGLFEKVNIKKLVTKENTTSENIIKELKAYKSLNPDDVFVFFVASHGTVDNGEYFLITSNVGSTRTEKLKTDALPQGMLKELIANIPATKKLIIIDTCSAGALGEAIQVAMLTRGMSEDTAMKILSRAVGSTILSASTSLQEAVEGYQGHGLFTYVLVEGLKGKADKGKTGYVKTTELADYVDSEVPVLAEKVFKKAQYPTISISGQAFPIGKTGK
jgi:WD40 repeat protein